MSTSGNVFNQMLEKIKTKPGFIAALDQSGGSTPKALKIYGIPETAYSNDEEMLSIMHEMRSRIITSPSFNGDRILGAILFENTLDREIQGLQSSRFLWEKKNVVPFLKVDKGLADLSNGVQLMKPISNLDSLLEKARAGGVFGTKMRSVIKEANAEGIAACVNQQFEIAHQIIKAGIVPIIEPEVDIHCPDKANAEEILKKELLSHMNKLTGNQYVMLKLTLPDLPGYYTECVNHPMCLKVVALSGGYSRDEANKKLSKNKGVIASFSRAFTDGLTAQQTDAQFDAMLNESIQAIFDASMNKVN